MVLSDVAWELLWVGIEAAAESLGVDPDLLTCIWEALRDSGSDDDLLDVAVDAVTRYIDRLFDDYLAERGIQ